MVDEPTRGVCEQPTLHSARKELQHGSHHQEASFAMKQSEETKGMEGGRLRVHLRRRYHLTVGSLRRSGLSSV